MEYLIAIWMRSSEFRNLTKIINTETMDKELKEIFDKYSGKEHYGYKEAKKELLDLFGVGGLLPFPVVVLDGLKIDIEFKNGGLIIKSNHRKN